MTLGDFNGDHVLDIAVANLDSASASVFQGRGDGSFSSPLLVSAGSNPEAIAAGDLNGDGKDELIIGDFGVAGIGDSLAVALSTAHVGPQLHPARDLSRRRHRGRSRALRARLVLHASPPRRLTLSRNGTIATFDGLTATGRITSQLIGGAAAPRGIPAAALDLLDVDLAATASASRYFDPPLTPSS